MGVGLQAVENVPVVTGLPKLAVTNSLICAYSVLVRCGVEGTGADDMVSRNGRFEATDCMADVRKAHPPPLAWGAGSNKLFDYESKTVSRMIFFYSAFYGAPRDCPNA